MLLKSKHFYSIKRLNFDIKFLDKKSKKNTENSRNVITEESRIKSWTKNSVTTEENVINTVSRNMKNSYNNHSTSSKIDQVLQENKSLKLKIETLEDNLQAI